MMKKKKNPKCYEIIDIKSKCALIDMHAECCRHVMQEEGKSIDIKMSSCVYEYSSKSTSSSGQRPNHLTRFFNRQLQWADSKKVAYTHTHNVDCIVLFIMEREKERNVHFVGSISMLRRECTTLELKILCCRCCFHIFCLLLLFLCSCAWHSIEMEWMHSPLCRLACFIFGY